MVSSWFWGATVTSFLIGSAVAQQLSSLAASQRDTPPHPDFTSSATGKHTWVPVGYRCFYFEWLRERQEVGGTLAEMTSGDILSSEASRADEKSKLVKSEETFEPDLTNGVKGVSRG